MRTFILIFLLIFLNGCASKHYRTTTINETITNLNNTISIHIPSDNWIIYKGTMLNIKGRIAIGKSISSSHLDIDFYDDPVPVGKLTHRFDKNKLDSLEQSLQKPLSQKQIKNDIETGVTYQKYWVSYVYGMKCSSNTFSRGVGGDYLPGGLSKTYTTFCAYYDTFGNKRQLDITYYYFYHPDSTGMTITDGKENIFKLSQQDVENELKYSVKTMIDSLQIKNFDRDRMKAEGLLYEQKYEIQPW